jgi:DNA polymerase-1
LLIALLDLDYIQYATCFSCSSKGLTDFGEVKACADGYINSILDALDTDYFIGFLQGKGNFRKDLYGGYKANRAKYSPPPYLKDLREYMIKEYLAVVVRGAESDDAISILHWRSGNTVICSPDKDFKQIPGVIYNTYKNNLEVITEEEAKYNLWKQVIMGDSVDCITGIEGVGRVGAAKILDNSQDYEGDTRRAYKNKYAGTEEFSLNYRLVKLLDKGLPKLRVRKRLYGRQVQNT